MSVKVKIWGPNLTDQSKGAYVVHSEACADNAKMARRESEDPWVIDATSVLEVVYDIYGDVMSDHGPPGTGERAVEGFLDVYVQDVHFAPCLRSLPYGEPVGGDA